MNSSSSFNISHPYKRLEEWLSTFKIRSFNIVIHACLGMFLNWKPLFSTSWAILLVVLGTYFILVTQNKSGWAQYFAAYAIGLELFLRMTKAGVFWEFGKYTAIYFLVLGLIFRRKHNKKSFYFLLYFYFLIPAIFLIDPLFANEKWRELISFNLSGPLTLCIGSIYFYKQKLTFEQFEKLSLSLLLPLITILFYLIRHLANIGTISFSVASNYQLSGDFGPNQVSTVLGFGFSIIILTKLLRISIFKYSVLGWIFSLGFLTFGILTFSRGGVIAGVLTSAFSFFLFNWGKHKKKSFYNNLFLLLIGIVLLTVVSKQINLYTEGFLGKRYFGHDDKHSRFTGREHLLAIENKMFKDHLLTGVGVGMVSSFRRIEYGYHKKASSHAEFSRMLAEHGIFGLCSLIVMLYLPFIHFRNLKNEYSRIVFSTFMGYALLTISHSSMRLALPCLLYGLSFITLVPRKNDEV